MTKKRKTIYIVISLVIVVYLVYKGYERWPTQSWKQYGSLVGIWPRLKSEKIESIRFTEAFNPQTGPDKESESQEIIKQCLELFSFRVRDENVVNSWVQGHEVPKEHLPECVNIIDKAMKNAGRPWWLGGTVTNVEPLKKMLIVTKKGKYIVPAEAIIYPGDVPKVYGEEWQSYELGKFLAKYCFPNREFKFKYELPSKEQTVAVLLYPPKVSPPLALFGDKFLAEKLLFEKEIKDDPNEVIGIAGLYKIARLRSFGAEFKKEGREYVPVSNELKPKKLFEGRDWLEKIMDAYEDALKEAEEREKYFPAPVENHIGRIVFMTQEKDYWKEIGIDANIVYDDYIRSERLKAYFDELGITKELSTAKTTVAESNDTNTAPIKQ